MQSYIDMTLAALAVVYAVDVSGFTQAWRNALARWLKVSESALRPLPPFDCGKCAAFWTCIAVTLAEGTLSFGTVAFAAGASLLALPVAQLMTFVREALTELVGRGFDKLNQMNK